MDLDHERLAVYQLTLDFLVLASEIIEGLPRGRSYLSDQFGRASLSIVLNLAEGAGSKPDKRRYYPPLPIVQLESNHRLPRGAHAPSNGKQFPAFRARARARARLRGNLNSGTSTSPRAWLSEC